VAGGKNRGARVEVEMSFQFYRQLQILIYEVQPPAMAQAVAGPV
jgi:hypothetical protein